MSKEERLAHLEQKSSEHNRLLKKLVSENVCLRAFAQALIEQRQIDLAVLRDDFVQLWGQAVQQLPPDMQDKTLLQELLTEIENVLTRRQKKWFFRQTNSS